MNPMTSPDNQFNSENQTGKSDRFIRDRFLVYHSLSDYSMAFETAVSVQVAALVFRLSLCYIKIYRQFQQIQIFLNTSREDIMKKLDSFPTHKIGDLEYRAGHVLPYGATLVDDAVNFSIFSKGATSCTLVLYHAGEREPFAEIPFPESFCIGNVFTMMVFGLDFEDIEYGYKMDGPKDPAGLNRFKPDLPLLDPYAKSVSGRNVWGEEPDWDDPFPHRGKIIMEDFDWEDDVPLQIPMKDLVIYEMHVRGFTRHPSSGDKYAGTFTALRGKIPYLKELGINCVELLPIFEFDEFEFRRGNSKDPRINYWGYSTLNFFSPKSGYAASSAYGLIADELKNLIKQFHQNGIEVILDVVFNHTAEGNENGPTISYRGIDNKTYYLTTKDGQYTNYSGCGNTMNCNNAVVRNHILDCLRYWASEYHIDGFRFDLASILTRDMEGTPMINPPLLETISGDAVLGSVKLIAEAWDACGLYQVGSFPSWNRWSEWNGKYRDCLRRFIKGGAECAPELYTRIAGSGDLYSSRSATASVNFITCHDGFTLHDLFSYNEKHNEANGEGNRDGCSNNDSWNCGEEGETNNPEVLALRERQMRNAFTILLTSRGVPMILAGDEFANTQFGNNNAYCQDNEISWLNWDQLQENKGLTSYVKTLLAFRSAHPVLRCPNYDIAGNGTGYPELSFHGTTPWQHSMDEPSLTFAYMYAEDGAKYDTGRDAFLYIAVNAHWEEHSFELPIIPEGMSWKVVVRSDAAADGRPAANGAASGAAGDDRTAANGAASGAAADGRPAETVSGRLTLGPRSTAVLIGARNL